MTTATSPVADTVWFTRCPVPTATGLAGEMLTRRVLAWPQRQRKTLLPGQQPLLPRQQRSTIFPTLALARVLRK